jgi:hypothetical protein
MTSNDESAPLGSTAPCGHLQVKRLHLVAPLLVVRPQPRVSPNGEGRVGWIVCVHGVGKQVAGEQSPRTR